MKVSAQLGKLFKAGQCDNTAHQMADIIAGCLVRETAEGTKNADQRTPGHQEGSAEIKRRIGKIKTRGSVHKN